MNLQQPLHFFLGANTPTGFVSFSDEITAFSEAGRLFVIKGGPGTGKSSLMRRAAEALCQSEPGMEYIHCSSDPDSLDAVLFPESGIAFADATPPHVIEPAYPGVCETVVSLTSCWDEEQLQSSRENVLPLFRQNSACHQQCVRFLSAARALLADNESTALSCTDPAKIARTAAGIVSRECRRRRGKSVEKHRFLTAVTPKGPFGFAETIAAFDKLYYIRDPYGASAGLLLAAIRSLLSEAGVTLYCCHSPLCPNGKLEHLLVPELGLAFVSETPMLPLELLGTPYRVISFTRFTDMEKLGRRRQRLRFNRRAAEELLRAASSSMRRGKLIHDRIEEAYSAAMDFAKVSEIRDGAIDMALAFQEKILSR